MNLIKIEETLCQAFETLFQRSERLSWQLTHDGSGQGAEPIMRWPGAPNEDVLIVVHQSSHLTESFHRHDYFYFTYTYRGAYDSIDAAGRRLTLPEGSLSAGQPFSGHALRSCQKETSLIISVLIRREALFHTFLPMLSADSPMFRFLMAPDAAPHSEETIHLDQDEGGAIRLLMEMMVTEAASSRENTPHMLKSLINCLFLQIDRQSSSWSGVQNDGRVVDQIIRYIDAHYDTVTLQELSEQFSYHPTYISNLLTRKTGKTFSRLVLEQRMERASLLLKGTSLPVSEIASMLGYRSSSNFYKAFQRYYHTTPRQPVTAVQKAGCR